MRCSLRRLQGACNLAVRGREQPGDLLGQRLVGSEPGELALPEVEIAPGQSIEFAGFVVFRGHAGTIAHRRRAASFAVPKPVLSHCGIGGKVHRPL